MLASITVVKQHNQNQLMEEIIYFGSGFWKGQGSIMAGRHGTKWQPWWQEQRAESLHLKHKHKAKANKKHSNPALSDRLPPARMRHQKRIPKQCHQLETKCTIIVTYGRSFSFKPPQLGIREGRGGKKGDMLCLDFQEYFHSVWKAEKTFGSPVNWCLHLFKEIKYWFRWQSSTL